LIDSQVLFGKDVYVLVGARRSHLNHLAAFVRDAVRLSRIVDVDRHTRITPHVFDLLMTGNGVNKDVRAVAVQPDLGNVRRSVGHQSRKLAPGCLFQ